MPAQADMEAHPVGDHGAPHELLEIVASHALVDMVDAEWAPATRRGCAAEPPWPA